ncbi:MAG: TonB-dependent receptor, partial [Gemmatimonadota bacterium]|nr:TonB-dependent receptor [Gemmatimonadota bacterium]
FAQANVELWDQLFVNGGVRGDKASTFGEEERFWYTNGSVAWEFTAHPMFSALRGTGAAQQDGPLGFLDFGKLRFAYGEAGQHPPVFSNVSAFTTGTIGRELNSVYAGFDGVVSEGTLGNPNIEPERSKEWEVGFELAMLDNRLALDVVRYDKQTEDAILSVPVAPSTGFSSRWKNGAEFDNEGWEVRLDGRPVQASNFTWDVSAQWAKDESCVKELLGTESVFLTGFFFSRVSVVQPRDIDGDGTPDEEGCFPFGVHRGGDFVRFGRDITVGGVDIDSAFPNAPEGAIFIAEDGLPRADGQVRVIGDPNPDWTGSLRNTVTLFDKVRLSALLDFVQGFDRWNGTKGVLFFFGTHEATGPCHGEGCTFPSFADYYDEVLNAKPETFAGPGVGQEVTLNWANWFLSGIGSAFTGPQIQFIEDASFVRLRDVSASYTFDQPRIAEAIGFSSIDVKVSGRNLATWTDYSGIDPEAELGDQILGRGLEYFNNPFTESWVFTLQFNR